MAKFLPPFDKLQLELMLEKDGQPRWRLILPLSFLSDRVGAILVPAGFVTDLASVPRLPFMYWLFGGKATRPAVIHDWLYEKQFFTREDSDNVFVEAADVDGYNYWTSRTMWAGIRAGGWYLWNKRG